MSYSRILRIRTYELTYECNFITRKRCLAVSECKILKLTAGCLLVCRELISCARGSTEEVYLINRSNFNVSLINRKLCGFGVLGNTGIAGYGSSVECSAVGNDSRSVKSKSCRCGRCIVSSVDVCPTVNTVCACLPLI